MGLILGLGIAAGVAELATAGRWRRRSELPLTRSASDAPLVDPWTGADEAMAIDEPELAVQTIVRNSLSLEGTRAVLKLAAQAVETNGFVADPARVVRRLVPKTMPYLDLRRQSIARLAILQACLHDPTFIDLRNGAGVTVRRAVALESVALLETFDLVREIAETDAALIETLRV